MTMPGRPASPQPGSGADATPNVVSGSDQNANEAVSAGERNPSAGQPAPPTPDPTGTAARPPQSPAVNASPGDQKLEDQQDAQQDGPEDLSRRAAGPSLPEPGEDLSARAAELENELAQVRARAAGQETVRVRVEGDHSGLIHNGVYVGTEWTEVPAHVLPALTEGAANSGVTLTQEETES